MPWSVETDSAAPAGRPSFFASLLTNRQKLTQRALIGAAVVAVIGIGIPPIARVLAQPGGEPEAKREMAAMPVRVLPATPSNSYEASKAYTGALVAARRSRLGFERPGKIVELLVDEGERVDQGQPLARLDLRRLNAQRMQAVAELAEAKAVLAELLEGPRKESIATAAAEVRSLIAQKEVAERNLRRRRELVETAAISREEYDESFYALRVTQARVEAAEKQLEELETGTRVERKDAQRARVEALAARLADVDHEIEDTVLTAPFAGAIARRQLDEGAIVAAGAPVFDLIEDAKLEAWIGVPSAVANRLTVGEKVSVDINGVRHEATVRSLRAELDPTTRTQNVVLDVIPTDGHRLVAGQVSRVLLSETVQRQGFWVPAGALAPHRRGLWAVYVAEGAGPTRTVATRDVELLHTEGGRSFVRGTLQEGELIIVAGGHKVVAGQRVAISQ